MTIDWSGPWWVGSDASDVAEYLLNLSDFGIQDYQTSKCACSSETFRVEFDASEGCVRRKCVECASEHLICDSADALTDAGLAKFSCVCGHDTTNLGVGFALREQRRRLFRSTHPEVSWIYVGVRCTECGVLGSIADWKVDYEPSSHLLDQA